MKKHHDKDKHENPELTSHDADSNPDPLTGAPGSHPVGTGVGAAAGGATGAAIGSVAGPVGAAVGIVAGAIAGGLAGKGAAEKIDPTREDEYWRHEYPKRTYADRDVPYETYQPAYRTGYEGYSRYQGRRYDEVESDLQRDYETNRGESDLGWDRARHATRDAWDRIGRAMPGDADHDGR
ncbi:MAG: hypothetical protein RBU21_07510 [FCB group bacterium]|jgi:hypothetical protein|nr:hypothetical protein [FCB group bacterium]